MCVYVREREGERDSGIVCVTFFGGGCFQVTSWL